MTSASVLVIDQCHLLRKHHIPGVGRRKSCSNRLLGVVYSEEGFCTACLQGGVLSLSYNYLCNARLTGRRMPRLLHLTYMLLLFFFCKRLRVRDNMHHNTRPDCFLLSNFWVVVVLYCQALDLTLFFFVTKFPWYSYVILS